MNTPKDFNPVLNTPKSLASINPIDLSNVSETISYTPRDIISYPLITYTPATLAKLSDRMGLNTPVISSVVKSGEQMEVLTYHQPSTDLTEIKLMYPKGLQESKEFDYALQLYRYAHDIGATGTGDTTIDLNNFLDWLGYKRDKDNTHQINTKKEVWRGIYNISRTFISTGVKYIVKKGKYKNSMETAISEQPAISSLVGFYRESGRDIETTEFRETPPYKIAVKFLDFFITQLQGKKLEGGGYIVKNLIIAPKIEAGLLQGKYQGFAKSLLEYLFMELKNNPPASGVRNYTKTELVKRASRISRANEALNKLVQLLNLFETDGHIKTWGVRQTLKGKQLSKQYRKSPYVWIDFNDTPAFIELKKFKPQPTISKTIKKLKGDLMASNERVKELERKAKEW